jgi:hypothetical protein
MVVKPHHFSNGRLKIRCSATIHDIYYQSTEKSVEEERPRGLLHGTLTAGGGVQYIPAPSPSTDLPPSGHRFDPGTVVQQSKFQFYQVANGALSVPLYMLYTWVLYLFLSTSLSSRVLKR